MHFYVNFFLPIMKLKEKTWERLPDLKTRSPQQRNVVLPPEFVDRQYAFYTRPQDDFIQAGSGGGIGWGLSKSMNPVIIEDEMIMDSRAYHTIEEVKNGQDLRPSGRPRAGCARRTAAGCTAATGASGDWRSWRATTLLATCLADEAEGTCAKRDWRR